MSAGESHDPEREPERESGHEPEHLPEPEPPREPDPQAERDAPVAPAAPVAAVATTGRGVRAGRWVGAVALLLVRVVAGLGRTLVECERHSERASPGRPNRASQGGMTDGRSDREALLA